MYICFILLINSSTTPVILTLSLHDALPIFLAGDQLALGAQLVGPVVQCHQQAVRPDPRHAGDSAIADAAVPRGLRHEDPAVPRRAVSRPRQHEVQRDLAGGEAERLEVYPERLRFGRDAEQAARRL